MYRNGRKDELYAKLNEQLIAAGLPESFLEDLVDLVEIIADEKADDVYDRVNQSGRYDPNY